MLVSMLLHLIDPGEACDQICYLTVHYLGAQRFPIVVSEFGSALNERSELDCFTSITDYFTSSGLANDGRHAPIQSWFYWCARRCLLSALHYIQPRSHDACRLLQHSWAHHPELHGA